MRALLLRLVATIACAGVASVGVIGLASSCGGPAHAPELPDPASPHGRPPVLSPRRGMLLDAPGPIDAQPPARS